MKRRRASDMGAICFSPRSINVLLLYVPLLFVVMKGASTVRNFEIFQKRVRAAPFVLFTGVSQKTTRMWVCHVCSFATCAP